MWLDNLKELKKATNMSTKQISQRSNLPEKTISRVFSGETKNPYIDTLNSIAIALGSNLTDILVDTKLVVGTEKLASLQAEKDLLIADNEILTNKVNALTSELELLKNELMYTKKLLAVHEYYTKTNG